MKADFMLIFLEEVIFLVENVISLNIQWLDCGFPVFIQVQVHFISYTVATNLEK